MDQYRERQKEIAKGLGFVRLLPINKDTYPEELFNELWERVSQADYAFEDPFVGDKVAFAASMLAEGTYNFEIPGEIFAQLTLAGPGTTAMIHFTSLSQGPTTPLIEAAAEMFWFAFEQVKVQRISAFIPEFNKKAQRLVSLLRMKFEGDMRKAFLYKGEYWDINIYGLLSSEYKRRGA